VKRRMQMQCLWAVTLSLGLVRFGIAAENPEEHAPVQAGQNFSNAMFDMSSPNSEGWTQLTQNERMIAFARSGSSGQESDVAAVELFSLKDISSEKDFLAFVKQGVEKDSSDPQFEVHQAKWDPSKERPYICVKYVSDATDHGGKDQMPKKPLQLQIQNLYCRYPKRPDIGFVVSFSHRGAAKSPNFQKEAESFIGGVQVAQLAPPTR
jgi:hypothetical protein